MLAKVKHNLSIMGRFESSWPAQNSQFRSNRPHPQDLSCVYYFALISKGAVVWVYVHCWGDVDTYVVLENVGGSVSLLSMLMVYTVGEYFDGIHC